MKNFSQETKGEFVKEGLFEHQNLNYQKAINLYSKALLIDSNFVEAYINRSNSYFELKDYKNALIDIEKALKLNPNQPISYNNRGLILKFQKKYNEALIDFEKAISLDKKYYEAYVHKLITLTESNRQEEAKQYVKTLKKEINTNPEICIVTYGYYSYLGDNNQAMAELNTGLALDKKNEKILSERAHLKDDINDDQGAVLDYNELIKLNPAESKYYFGRSSSNYDLKQYEKVIDDCTKAIELNKNYYAAYVMRGDVYDTMGEEVKSIADYEKAITIRPDYEFAYNELGKIYYIKKQYSKALEVLNRILENNPNIISSLEYRAACKSETRDFNGAIADYDKIILLNPKDYKAYINKGFQEDKNNAKVEACNDVKKGYYLMKNKLSEDFAVAHNFLYTNCKNTMGSKNVKIYNLQEEARKLYEEKKLDLVIQKFDEMIKIVPDSSFLYYDRGKMKRELNLHKEAILDYKKAIQYDKKNIEAWSAMSISYMYLLNYEEAIKTSLEAIKADENYAPVYHNLALIYAEQKDFFKAIKYFELAIKKDAKYVSAYYELGINYLMINEKEKACYYFKIAESLGSIPAKLKVISECRN